MSNQSKNVKSEISELEMCNVGADMPQEAAQISENSYFNDAPYPDENPYFHASPFGGYYPQRYVFQDTVEGALPITLGEGWLSNALTELCSRVHDRARFDSETMDEEVVAQQDQEANPPSCIYSEETRQIASKYMRDCKGHTRLSNKQKLEAVWKDFNANGLIDLAYEYNERNKPTYHEVDSESAASGSQPLYRENPLKQSSEGNENIWAYNDNGSFVTTNSGDSNDAHMITLSDLVNKGPRVKNDSTSTAKAFCRFCANSGYEFEHPMTDSNGATLCPHLRKLVCQKCSQTGDNAHTLRKCPLYGKVPPAVISNDHAYNYTLPPRGIDAPNWSPFFERAEFNTPEIAPEHEVQEGASGGNSNDWVDEFLQKCSLANKDDGYNSASPPRGGASNGSAFWAEKKSAEDAFFGADTP